MSEFLRRTFPQLINLVYGASLDPARWQTFLDALSAPFGGASGVLYGFDPSRGYVDFHYNYGTEPEYCASYLQHYAHINPYGHPSSNLPVGQVCMASHGVNIGEVLKTEFYNCWMRPQGIPADHFGIVLHKDSTKHVTFGLAPQASVLHRNLERYARELEMLVPHMMRALEINRLTAAAHDAERIAGVALEAIDAAAFILTGDGRLVRHNSRAENLLRLERVLRISPHGALWATSANEDAALRGAIARQASLSLRSAIGPLRLTSQRDGARYMAWLVATSAPDEDVVAPGTSRPPALLVLLVNRVDQRLTIPPEDIQRAFDLSAAEARLVAALVAGRQASDYASDLGLSRNTVRNHLAAAFSKTSTSRQSELVALVIGSLRWVAR